MTLVVGLAVLMVASGVRADWDKGDPYKMHQPQLPDPKGWDIAFGPTTGSQLLLADDWLCTQTGAVSDIHFWISFQGDEWSKDPADVGPLWVGLWSNQPGSKLPPKPSRPLDRLWARSFKHYEYTFRQDGQGDQGFYNPETGEYTGKTDHKLIYQINITDIPNPFIQEEGKVYWLSLQMDMHPDDGTIGWKTSSEQWADDAVWTSWPYGDKPIPWHPIQDPRTGESLDLAFVITPEPATLALLGLGAVGLAARRRRRQA